MNLATSLPSLPDFGLPIFQQTPLDQSVNSPKSLSAGKHQGLFTRKSDSGLLAHQLEMKNATRDVIEGNTHLIQRMTEVEEGLRGDMQRNFRTIEDLDKKVNASQSKIRQTIEIYTKQQEAQREIDSALMLQRREYDQGTESLRILTKRLTNLRSKQAKLEHDVSNASTALEARVAELDELIEKRVQVESLRVRLEEADPTESREGNIDASTQTSMDLGFFYDVEMMRVQMRLQGKTLKEIRKSIDLVKRCS